jgi:hypothetical protein
MEMKKKIFLQAAVIGFLGLGLTSCKKGVVTDTYGLDAGSTAKISYVLHEAVTDYNGSFKSITVEETYLPGIWARLSETDATASNTDIETIKVENVQDYDGLTKTLYYAKHIQIGTTTWTGDVRGDTDMGYYQPGENIKYTLDTATAASADKDQTDDYMRYLTQTDSGLLYKVGERYRDYYTAIVNNKVAILRTASAVASDTLLNGYQYTYKDSTVSPAFPNGIAYRSQQTTETKWVANVTAVTDYLVNTCQKLDYLERAENTDLDKFYTLLLIHDVWNYNPKLKDGFAPMTDITTDPNWQPIPGTDSTLSLLSIVALFKAANYGFAAGEYSSIRG